MDTTICCAYTTADGKQSAYTYNFQKHARKNCKAVADYFYNPIIILLQKK